MQEVRVRAAASKTSQGLRKNSYHSVSALAGLRSYCHQLLSKMRFANSVETFSRMPLPILVLLDEIDRMQKDELLVLLKILRGAARFQT